MAEHHSDLPPLRYAALNDALLDRISSLVPEWLPGGETSNNEYFVHSAWRQEKTPSLSVRMGGDRVGQWRDHGGDKVGGDLISLYAALHDMGNAAATVELARTYGLEDVAGVVMGAGTKAPARPPRPLPPPAPPAVRSDEGWQTVTPVPEFAPAATFKHHHRKPEDIQHTATYSIDGELYGYVVRFATSEGGKETLPFTWCQSAKDGACRWHWKQWAEPRPLYFPGGYSPIGLGTGSLPTVILVEGEKKAGILHALLQRHAPDVYLVASWPGGSKAYSKADWKWLNGCHVVMWPDCDGKRELLTTAERDAYPDDMARAVAQAAKPLLPAAKQVGMVAMTKIGELLRSAHACTVQLLPIPEPLEVVDGWDCADAIETDGWDFDRVLQFFGQAQPLPGGAVPEEPKAGAAAGGGGGEKNRDSPAEAGDDDDAFQGHLDFLCDQLKCKVHELGVNRKMLIKALRKAPALKDCLGYNELTGAPGTQVPWPWRSEAGPLNDSDDLRLGDYLCTTYKIKAASRAALAEAIDTVADERRFHPIRDWLGDIKHDGKPRIDKWLIYVLGMDPEKLAPKRKRYLVLVGRFLLLGMVNRVMEPGCKFDYSPVFEGLPGVGKSTFVKTLVGTDFFSDTHFDVGSGKDGFEQLEGLWGYELSELTALRKADSEQVKQFFSSTVDRFRGAYGKYVQSHPRQCVIFCSTNKKQYLYDLTGNRRFWPIWIDQPIKLEWLRKFRDQLFAEAFALYQIGARFAPTRDEEDEFFIPEQKARLIETAVQSRLYELLTRKGSPPAEGTISKDLNQLVTFVTLDRLVAALGADAAKSSTLLESQVRGWLEAHGWIYGRESTGQRRRGYKQPKDWPPKIEDDDVPQAGTNDGPAQGQDHEGNDDDPF